MGSRSKGRRPSGRSKYLAAIPALLLAGLIAFLTMSPPQSVTVTVSATGAGKAPDFTLPIIAGEGLAGRDFTLSSLRGRPVFMDFVFEWCPHCNNMAPTVERLYREFGDRVAFVTVMGSQGTTPERSARFISRHGIGWTAVYDSDMKVFQQYGVRGTPTYFIIRADGTMAKTLVGEQGYDTLRQALAEIA
jgi:peroxiredoxin